MATSRFNIELTDDDLEGQNNNQLHDTLIQHSRKQNEKANQLSEEALEKVESLFRNAAEGQDTLELASGGNGQLDQLASWLSEATAGEVEPEDLAPLDRQKAKNLVSKKIESHFRPEMRRLGTRAPAANS